MPYGGSEGFTFNLDQIAKPKTEEASDLTDYRLGCEDDDGRPVHPNCANPNGNCGCGKG
jgi:hypothetical protein